MNIRQANDNDAKAIHRLLIQLGYQDLTEDDVLQKIRSHLEAGYKLLVSEMDDKAVGFISMHWHEMIHAQGKLGRITAFCIDENLRSQGLGAKLLKTAEEILSLKGCFKIEVTSNVKRIRTHAFYIKCGYAEDSKRFVKMIHRPR